MFQFFFSWQKILTPERHENSIKDSARMIKQVRYLGIPTDLVQRPSRALFTERAHSDAKIISTAGITLIISYLYASGLHISLAMEFWSRVANP